MITIYHNNRCRKSRESLEILQKSGKEFKIINYLETVPSKKDLKMLLNLLDIPPIDLIRKNEAIWKELFKGKDLSDTDLIDAMISYPKLIERPIVHNQNKAVIGRPPERVTELLKT